MHYQSPPGLFDILPEGEIEPWKLSHYWKHVESTLKCVAEAFCFREMRTPVIEKTELFTRSSGTTSDIVSKEMYTFRDRGGRELSLRPEGTAPALRALLQARVLESSPQQKLYYLSSMFRYGRPQSGRYRQHHQFGVEAIGIGHPEQDAELIDLAYSSLVALGLRDVEVEVNSIGDLESRALYRTALCDYLDRYVDELSEESLQRLKVNPLRILDSKDPGDQKICSGAPRLLDSLNESSKRHFERVLQLLDLLKIPHRLSNRLVRGLDYYTHTVFELVHTGEEGSLSLCGGGRYDGLIAQLGGRDLPAAGFGMGLERCIQTLLRAGVLESALQVPLLTLIPIDSESVDWAIRQASALRREGVAIQVDLSQRKLGKAMQQANRSGSRYVAVVGETEREGEKLEIKAMESGEQQTVPLEGLTVWLHERQR